jgi:hypothetical protein
MNATPADPVPMRPEKSNIEELRMQYVRVGTMLDQGRWRNQSN